MCNQKQTKPGRFQIGAIVQQHTIDLTQGVLILLGCCASRTLASTRHSAWYINPHLFLSQILKKNAPEAFFRRTLRKPEEACVYCLRGIHEHDGIMHPRSAIQPQHRRCDVAADGAAADAG
jgi:hypothetical protein